LVFKGSVAKGTCGAGRGTPRPQHGLGLGKGSEGFPSNPRSWDEGWSLGIAAAPHQFGPGTFCAGLGPGGKGLTKDEEQTNDGVQPL